MKVTGVVSAVVGVLAAAAAGLIWMLARRVVGTKPRRKTLVVRGVGDAIELPRSDLTAADGNYGLWFGERFQHHALIGPVAASDAGRVTRRILKTTAPIGPEPFKARWTGHTMSGPDEVDPNWEDVTVPLRDGASAPAWLFRGTTADAPWVIHVQGIRTSRLVTLRSVEVAQGVGLTSLVITYRGSGDGPRAVASTLGQREWTDLADAVAYARAHGAATITIVAWSMGAGIALELLRRVPGAFDRLALIAPATKWSQVIGVGVDRAGLPAATASAVIWALRSRLASRCIGLPEPLDFARLDWIRADIKMVPTLLIHSEGDAEIPFELTKSFVATHQSTTLAQTKPAAHGWEANVDREKFKAALTSFLSASGVAPMAD